MVDYLCSVGFKWSFHPIDINHVFSPMRAPMLIRLGPVIS